MMKMGKTLEVGNKFVYPVFECFQGFEVIGLNEGGVTFSATFFAVENDGSKTFYAPVQHTWRIDNFVKMLEDKGAICVNEY